MIRRFRGPLVLAVLLSWLLLVPVAAGANHAAMNAEETASGADVTVRTGPGAARVQVQVTGGSPSITISNFSNDGLQRVWSGSLTLCDGDHDLQVRLGRNDLVGNGTTWGSWEPGPTVSLARGLATPSGVSVATDVGTATVSWDAPALSGTTHEVFRDGERITSGAGTSYTDDEAPVGEVSYTVRANHDCRHQSAMSAAAGGTVPAPDSDGGDGSTDGTDDGSTDGDGEDSTDGGSDESKDDDSTDGGSGDDDDSSTSPPVTRTERPRTLDTQDPVDVDDVEEEPEQDVAAPQVAEPEEPEPEPAPEEPEERFYGDDMEFDEELDFSDVEGDERDGSGEDDDLGAVAVGGSGGVDADNLRELLAPLAGALILVALGFHLRTWSQVPVADRG